MTQATAGRTVSVHFTPEQVAALEAWIDRHGEPRIAIDEAVRQVVAGRLGCERPSTILAGFVTGRDLV